MHATTWTTLSTIFKLKRIGEEWTFCVLAYEHWECWQMLVEIMMKSVELNLDQVHAINLQSHFSRKQSFVWKNFILYYPFSFSCRITIFPLVPPVTPRFRASFARSFVTPFVGIRQRACTLILHKGYDCDALTRCLLPLFKLTIVVALKAIETIPCLSPIFTRWIFTSQMYAHSREGIFLLRKIYMYDCDVCVCLVWYVSIYIHVVEN